MKVADRDQEQTAKIRGREKNTGIIADVALPVFCKRCILSACGVVVQCPSFERPPQESGLSIEVYSHSWEVGRVVRGAKIC